MRSAAASPHVVGLPFFVVRRLAVEESAIGSSKAWTTAFTSMPAICAAMTRVLSSVVSLPSSMRTTSIGAPTHPLRFMLSMIAWESFTEVWLKRILLAGMIFARFLELVEESIPDDVLAPCVPEKCPEKGLLIFTTPLKTGVSCAVVLQDLNPVFAQIVEGLVICRSIDDDSMGF